MEKSDRLAMFVAGLGAGVAAGMLLAPYRGEELRQRMRSGASQAGGFLQENAAKLRDAADGVLAQGKEFTDKAMDKIDGAAETARQAAVKVAGKSKDWIPEAGKKVQDGGKRMQDA